MKTDELVKRLREHVKWARANEWEVPTTLAEDLEDAAKRVEEAERENVDAVPVVRCKDCVLHKICIMEDRFKFVRIENQFCCVGKRKGGDE